MMRPQPRSDSSFKAYRDSSVEMRATRALILLAGAVMALWGVQAAGPTDRTLGEDGKDDGAGSNSRCGSGP